MAESRKILITQSGQIDLGTYKLDDQRLSEALVKANGIKEDQALDVSQFMRDAIDSLNIHTVTAEMLDEVMRAKLMEYDAPGIRLFHTEPSLFVKNGLKLSENAETVLARRYLKKDESGTPTEKPSQMFRRVARHIAEAELAYGEPGEAWVRNVEEQFYDLMTDLKFLPNSPTLMNAGRQLGQLAACFVLPVEDSLDGIFDALKNAAVIHKSGGGTGFSFSRLRPKNSQVGTTGGIASGPVSFMKIFNTATEQVKQGGTRRGANMAILRVDHPDIMAFIHCKDHPQELNNFNISVGVTASFMAAVEKGSEYALIDPQSGRETGRLKAQEVFDALVSQAWKSGDPGIVFLDRINQDNPTPAIGEIESTNPCGEQPLLPMEACNLGSINLSAFVTRENDVPMLDEVGLKSAVWTAVRFLDNTIDMSRYPLPAIEEMVKGNRKIGLGVMGFADLLFQLGIAYNSEKGLAMAETLMALIQEESHNASLALAEERGPFPNYEKSVYAGNKDKAFRNATVTTIAPTGTLSIIAGCSSGIEPLFALSFVRNVMDDDRLVEVNPTFEIVAKKRGFYSEELMAEIAKKGTIQHMETIPEEVRKVFVTAHDIDPEWHLRMQAAFQNHTDNAVSKTVNLPKEATVEDVRKIYNLAHELRCKGVTIYRDGSKKNQVLSFSGEPKVEGGNRISVKSRPEILEGFTSKIQTGLGQLYITVTEYEGAPFEVFATIGKSGRSTTAKTEAIGRLVSLALRSGVTVDRVIKQLKGIGGEHPVFREGGMVLSIPDAIARVLERRYMKEGALRGNVGKSLAGNTCPECGQTISFEEGCATCHFCGFSKCG